MHILISSVWDAQEDGPFKIALYNLDEDIAERFNVAQAHVDIVEQLRKLLRNFKTEIKNYKN